VFNRGCYFKCNFCSVPIFWGCERRSHNPEKIITELKQLSKLNYKGKISIEDSTLNLKSEKIKDFLIKAKKIKRKYSFDYFVTRYDFIDGESLRLMKQLGFNDFVVGLESASQKVLDNIGKNINLQKFKDFCLWIKDFEINLNVFLMVGLPGETQETFNETYEFVNDLVKKELISNLFVSYFTPYPGTKAAEKDLKKYGGKIIVKEDDFSDWVFKKDPLVEYPHLSREEIKKMYNKLLALNEKSTSKFAARFQKK